MLFCEKCGSQIDEGSAFCHICGAAVTAVEKEPVAPQVEEVTAEEIATEENIPMDTFHADDMADTNQKKKRRFPLWAKIGIPVVALGLVAVIVLNISTIWGLLLKWFGSDEAYFRYVQANAIEEMSENFVENYYSSKTANESKTTLNMGLTFDDSIGDLIPEESKEVLNLINDVEFTTTINSKSDKIGADLILGFDDKTLLTLETIMDTGSNSIYLTVPEILDKYLVTKLDTSEDIPSFAITNKLFEAMPENDVMKNLINDYSKVIFDSVEKVEKDSKTLTIEGIEQDCTTLTFELTEELAIKMVTAVLEKAKDDETVEDIFKEIQKTVGIQDSNSDFSDSIDEALDELNDYDAEDVTYAEITEYVNSSHEIIGFEIEIEGQSVSYATISDDKDLATEINFADQILVVGKGTIENDLLNAKYTLKMAESDLAEVKISNCDVNLAKKGLFAGNIKLSLSEEGLDLLSEESDEAAYALKLLNPSIEIDIKRPNENKCDVKFNIRGSNNTLLLGLDIEAQTSSKADNITVPEDAIDINDDIAMQEFASSIDFSKILEILEEVELPDEIYQMFSLLFESSSGESPVVESYDDDNLLDDLDDYSDLDDLSDIEGSISW